MARRERVRAAVARRERRGGSRLVAAAGGASGARRARSRARGARPTRSWWRYRGRRSRARDARLVRAATRGRRLAASDDAAMIGVTIRGFESRSRNGGRAINPSRASASLGTVICSCDRPMTRRESGRLAEFAGCAGFADRDCGYRSSRWAEDWAPTGARQSSATSEARRVRAQRATAIPFASIGRSTDGHRRDGTSTSAPVSRNIPFRQELLGLRPLDEHLGPRPAPHPACLVWRRGFVEDRAMTDDLSLVYTPSRQQTLSAAALAQNPRGTKPFWFWADPVRCRRGPITNDPFFRRSARATARYRYATAPRSLSVRRNPPGGTRRTSDGSAYHRTRHRLHRSPRGH